MTVDEQDELEALAPSEEETLEWERQREEDEQQLTRDYYAMACGSLTRGNGW